MIPQALRDIEKIPMAMLQGIFIGFCLAKGSEKYQYTSNQNCALAQFGQYLCEMILGESLSTHGLTVEAADVYFDIEKGGELYKIKIFHRDSAEAILISTHNTFGALALALANKIRDDPC